MEKPGGLGTSLYPVTIDSGKSFNTIENSTPSTVVLFRKNRLTGHNRVLIFHNKATQILEKPGASDCRLNFVVLFRNHNRVLIFHNKATR